MGVRWRCYLDNIQIEEPTNMADIELSLVRDESLHGIGFSATTGALNFIKDGSEYIQQVKREQGLKANITFKANTNCEDDSDNFETIIEGKLNLGKYKKDCGTGCTVHVPLDSATCETIMRNRYDQAVDLDNDTSFNGINPLAGYNDLAVMLDMPTRELNYVSSGYVEDNGDIETLIFPSPGGGSEAYVLARPEYKNQIAANIHDTHLINSVNVGYNGPSGTFLPVSNQILFNEANIKCFEGQIIIVNGRLKGTFVMPGVSNLDVYFVVLRGELKPEWPINDPDQLIQQVSLGTFNTGSTPQAFDFSMDEYLWTPSNSGSDGLYFYMAFHQHPGANFNGNVTFDEASFFTATTTKSCPSTKASSYLIHETLSRVTEAITDGCVRVKSEYYGRTDSQPFDFPSDGCGGLRMLTSGLKLRNAVNAKFFASLKDLIEGLRKIDNIGMGVEADPDLPNGMLLRVEEIDFFYQDKEIMRCDGITNGAYEIEEERHYGKINIGYRNWKTQDNFGLDEFNSDREFRTSLTTVSNTLDATSEIIAGEYPIELTREQQYVDTSEADTTYDDNIFIVCLARSGIYGYPYGGLVVEQGNISNPNNIFSPNSVYNYRLSPMHNLMKWFRTIAAGYPDIVNSDNRIFFSKGTGNLLASGQIAQEDSCKLESMDIMESQDLNTTFFKDIAKATPIWRNEIFSFDGYPMSVADYKKIKENPYGYISFQCDQGEFEKGWIKEIVYQPAAGTANLTLRLKW